jgi:hypothetical protein
MGVIGIIIWGKIFVFFLAISFFHDYHQIYYSQISKYLNSTFGIYLRLEVLIRFVDIGGIADDHCLNFLFTK